MRSITMGPQLLLSSFMSAGNLLSAYANHWLPSSLLNFSLFFQPKLAIILGVQKRGVY